MSKNIFSKKLSLLAMLSAGLIAQSQAVETQWWFDVEVILFERNLDVATIPEKFEQSSLAPASSDHLDLISPFLKPDLSYLRAGLSYCRTSNQLAVKKQYEEDFAFPMLKDEESADGAELAERAGSSESAELLTNDDSLEITDGLGVLDNVELLEQEKALEPIISMTSDVLPEEKLELTVGDSDILFPSDPDVQLSLITQPDEMTPSDPLTINGVHIDSLDDLALDQELNFHRPPIVVEFIEWQQPSVFPCAYAEQIEPSFASITEMQQTLIDQQETPQIKRVPDIIGGVEWQKDRRAYLLSTESMFMADLYEKIKKQRDIRPILHLNWRQEVKFGRANGQTYRLFAGENFAEEFTGNGQAKVADTDDLFTSLEKPVAESYIPEEELVLLSPEQQQALFSQIHASTGEMVAGEVIVGEVIVGEIVEDDLFTKIATALADDSPLNFEQIDAQPKPQSGKSASAIIQDLWRIDGGITVYLRNVGRVPYLHIDSNLDFRQPIFNPKLAQSVSVNSLDIAEDDADVAIAVNQPQQANYLQSVNFNQLRRVISKQVHYFDHPLFGMIVHINRYRWPEVPEESELPEDDSEAVAQ